MSEANEGFGGARTRARVYSEHGGVEKHEVHYPVEPPSISILSKVLIISLMLAC